MPKINDFEFVKNEIKKGNLSVLRETAQFVLNSSKKMLELIEIDPNAVNFASGRLMHSRRFWFGAAEGSHALKGYHIIKKTADEEERTASAAGKAFENPFNDKNFLLELQKQGHFKLPVNRQALITTKQEALAEVKKNSDAYFYLLAEHQADRDIMLEAVKTDHEFYGLITDENLQNDTKIILASRIGAALDKKYTPDMLSQKVLSGICKTDAQIKKVVDMVSEIADRRFSQMDQSELSDDQRQSLINTLSQRLTVVTDNINQVQNALTKTANFSGSANASEMSTT